MILSGKTLYSTAYTGGVYGDGTVFAVNTNGSDFTTLYNFSLARLNGSLSAATNTDGANPKAGLVVSGNTLYGTAAYGGLWGNGTVFSISFPPPQLSIASFTTNVNLTWSSVSDGFYGGFSVQTTTNLLSPVAWTDVLLSPVIINGLDVVTNPVSGAQQFFRLSQ